MNENRDEATGQFSSDEPVFGQAALEQEAGYVPMPKEPDETEELTAQEAAAKLTESRTDEADIVTHSAGIDIPDNMTMTTEQAAKALTDARGAEEAQAEIDDADKLRKEVDELRGVKPENETKAEEPAELDVEKTLNHPKIRDAIASHISEAETARQNHVTGLAGATQLAEATFFSQYPEFMNVAPEQRGAVFAAIEQNDPARAASIRSTVENIGNLVIRYGVEHDQVTAKAKAEFGEYAKAQDAKFAELTKGENMRAIESEIPAMLTSLGVDPKEWLEAGAKSKFLRSAAAQAILVKAAKYDLLQKAGKAVASKAVPPVQRPGVARSTGDAREGTVRALNEKFNSNPSLKNAAEMRAAQIKARA